MDVPLGKRGEKGERGEREKSVFAVIEKLMAREVFSLCIGAVGYRLIISYICSYSFSKEKRILACSMSTFCKMVKKVNCTMTIMINID